VALAAIWQFAATFDAYRYLGVQDTRGRLGSLGESVWREFEIAGRIPLVGEIGILRACLSYERHVWCTPDDDRTEMSVEHQRYLRALLGAIRERVG
jgi:hypothetical protein